MVYTSNVSRSLQLISRTCIQSYTNQEKTIHAFCFSRSNFGTTHHHCEGSGWGTWQIDELSLKRPWTTARLPRVHSRGVYISTPLLTITWRHLVPMTWRFVDFIPTPQVLSTSRTKTCWSMTQFQQCPRQWHCKIRGRRIHAQLHVVDYRHILISRKYACNYVGSKATRRGLYIVCVCVWYLTAHSVHKTSTLNFAKQRDTLSPSSGKKKERKRKKR